MSAPAPRWKREPLFNGFWTDVATGERLGRVSRVELRAAHRLWMRHADIRQGRANTEQRRRR